jgi:hypothetical protein
MVMTDAELELLIDRAAKRGASEALKDVGLYDDEARDDIKEIRSLLEVWRDTKRTIGQTTARFLTMTLLAILAAGAYMEFGDK